MSRNFKLLSFWGGLVGLSLLICGLALLSASTVEAKADRASFSSLLAQLPAPTLTLAAPPTSPAAASPSASNGATKDDLLVIQAQLQALGQQFQQNRQDALEAKNSAGAAVTFGLLGILLGIISLLVAVLALLGGRTSGSTLKGKGG